MTNLSHGFRQMFHLFITFPNIASYLRNGCVGSLRVACVGRYIPGETFYGSRQLIDR